MGRSSYEQAARTREKILSIAAGLCRASGPQAVSIKDVTTAAGLTTGAFYKHFASREALLRECIERSFGEAASSWSSVAAGDGTNAALVAHYLSPKPPEHTCPMLAFGLSPVPSEQYRQGTETLFEQFRSTMPPGSSDSDAAVRFAAMIGANLLALTIPGSNVSDVVGKAVRTFSED